MCLLGLVVMFGWLAHSASLVQILPQASAMRFNTALLFSLCGLALLQLASDRRRAPCFLGGLVAAFAAATASQDWLNIDLGIDNLLFQDWSGIGPNPCGRMAINTAFCFVLTGLTILSGSCRGAWRIQPLLEGVSGSLVFAVGTASALGYFSGIEGAYGWGGSTGMALHTALGFSLCGGSLLRMAVDHEKVWCRSASWLPISAAIMVLAISLVFWQALHQSRHAQIQRLTELQAESIARRIADRISERIHSVERMANRWTVGGQPRQAHWEADAKKHLQHFADLQSLGWIDVAGQLRWRVNSPTYDMSSRASPPSDAKALESIRAQRQPGVFLTSEAVKSGSGTTILCPLFCEEDFRGYLYCGVHLPTLIHDLVEDVEQHGYAVSVFEGPKQIYGLASTKGPAADLVREQNLNCCDIPLRIHLWPTSQALMERGDGLINATLVMGLLRTVMVALLVYFIQQSRRRLQVAEEAGKALQASERRFRAILDQTFQFIGLMSTDGTLLQANRSSLEFAGIPEGDVVGKPFWETPWWAHSPLEQEKLRDAISRAARGEMVRFEATHLDSQGNSIVVDFSLKPVCDEQGVVQMLIPEGRDITALKQAQARTHQVIEQAPNGILLVNQQGKIVLANSKIDDLFGYERAEFIGREIELLIPEAVRQGHFANGNESLSYPAEQVHGSHRQVRGRRKDGSSLPLEISLSPVMTEDGPAVLSSVVDISQRLEAEQKLRASEQRYEWAVRGSSDGIWDWNLETQDAYYSPRYKQLLGYADDEFADVIESFSSHLHPEDAAIAKDAINANLERGEQYNAVLRLRTKAHEWRWFRLRGDAIRGADGRALRMAGSMADVTDSVLAEQELTRNSCLDKLTGLPNRTLFLDRLQQTILRARRGEKHLYAVMFLDFDRFKLVNDSLGHDVGDALLKEIAGRLQENVRSVDSVSRRVTGNSTGRLGGDEFVVLLDDMQQPEEVLVVAERLIEAFAQPYQLGAHEVYSTASIGIVIGDARYERAEEAIRDADMAMYEAKRAGKARYVVFDTSMRLRLEHRVQLENDLRKALHSDQLSLVFQPIISLSSGDTTMVESLLRWQHPTEGEINPGEFISIAEESELIQSLGDWALLAGCRQMAAWTESLGEFAPSAMSINLSPKQFARRTFVRDLQRVLAETGLDPSRLQLEIKEDAFVKDVAIAIETMREIRELGVRLAIDNFGTGIASFASLHRLPIDMLKVDRSLMIGLEHSKDAASLIHALAVLVRNLGICLVAEGVESTAQVMALQELGCEFGQGYFFARPMTAEAFADFALQNGGFSHESSGAAAFGNRLADRMVLETT